jgi:HSP20 family protein
MRKGVNHVTAHPNPDIYFTSFIAVITAIKTITANMLYYYPAPTRPLGIFQDPFDHPTLSRSSWNILDAMDMLDAIDSLPRAGIHHPWYTCSQTQYLKQGVNPHATARKAKRGGDPGTPPQPPQVEFPTPAEQADEEGHLEVIHSEGPITVDRKNKPASPTASPPTDTPPVMITAPSAPKARELQRNTTIPHHHPHTHLAQQQQSALTPLWFPRMDVDVKDHAVTILTDLPGVPRENVAIDLSPEGVLSVTGERASQVTSQGHTERFFGRFSRSVRLPRDVQAEGASATFEEGVLRIDMPRKVEGVGKVRIPICGGEGVKEQPQQLEQEQQPEEEVVMEEGGAGSA